MASHTKQRKAVKKWKSTKRGKGRKQELAKGTTPRFPVHMKDDPTAVVPQPPGAHPDEK
jgi:hypothetical protein